MQLLHYPAITRAPPCLGWQYRSAARPGARRHAWGTIGSLRLTAASTSRSVSLSHATQAHPSSHEGVRVPTGCLAGPASGQRQRGQRSPGVRMAGGTLCALYPCGKLRNLSIAAVSRSSLASCRDCRATVPGLSVFGVPTRAWGSTSERAATEPHARGPARRSLRCGHGPAERWEEIPEPAGCGSEGSSFTNRGSWNRGVCLHRR